MKPVGALGTVVALALAGTTSLAETARPTSPISAELAKTCRELAIKAHLRSGKVAVLALDRLSGTISKSALPNAAICRTRITSLPSNCIDKGRTRVEGVSIPPRL
jgi:hypothetical protein